MNVLDTNKELNHREFVRKVKIEHSPFIYNERIILNAYKYDINGYIDFWCEKHFGRSYYDFLITFIRFSFSPHFKELYPRGSIKCF